MISEPDKAQQLRRDALRSRVMVANALCAIAESEVRAGMRERALDSLRTIRRTIEQAAVLVRDPNHIAPGAARDLSEFLAESEERTRMIEAIVAHADQARDGDGA